MMDIQRFQQLGAADFGWLQAKHHFSFGRYYNPARMGFANLRVVNDDRIAMGNGFQPHPHDNMEIITYVRQGEIRHKDNLGNNGTTPAGSVQVMSAGTGIEHAEYASDTDNTILYQIWILPREEGVAPRWDMAEFPTQNVAETLPLLVSGLPEHAGKGALFIHADAAMYGGRMAAGTKLQQAFGNRVYVLVSKGDVEVQGQLLHAGDGAALVDEEVLSLHATTDAEVVVLQLTA